MNLLLSICILSVLNGSQNPISSSYFYKYDYCTVGSVITVKFKLDLSSEEHFVFSKISKESGFPKPKVILTSLTGKWKYENGVLTLYPINLLNDHRGLYPNGIQFKADLFSITKLISGSEMDIFPRFMTSENAPRL